MPDIPKIDIRPDHWELVRCILQKHVPQYPVWAFGSRAKWTAKEYSDLDLCVISDQFLGFNTLAALADDFSESDLPWKVDVVDWATTSASFRKIIERDKVVVQEVGSVIACEWERVTVADVCELIVDCVNKTAPVIDEHTPFKMLRTTNIKDGRIDREDCRLVTKDTFVKWTRRADVRRGDVILTREAPMGEVGYVDFDDTVFLGQRLMQYRANPMLLESRFLLYSFLSKDLQNQFAAHEGNGSTVSHIRVGDCSKFQLTLPPLPEQKAIAHILGSLDDKIELNRRMNVTLEAMARALFQSWFVDFDPVRAKLDGRTPDGLDSETAALFPKLLEHGENGMLPIGWRHAAIEELCAINAWTLGKNDALKTLEYVEISEVSRGNITNIATYLRGEEPSRARRRLRHGDTVLSTVRPDRGAYFLALNPPENRVASTGFAVLTPTTAPWSFLHAALTQSEVSDHLGKMADGGAYPAVRPEIIGAIQIALPNEPKILQAFHRNCAPLFEQADANRIQSRTLATLRDALLPKLLSGELRVADTINLIQALG